MILELFQLNCGNTFLNLFIIAFITISYVYISEPFGSISTVYIGNQEISLLFIVSLLLFTFLSVLAGSINSFFAGFLGEFLFQLAFYGTIYLEWCFIIAIYGFLIGIYKYRPLKYHKKINVFYSFLALIISSIIMFWFIFAFQIIFYPGQFTLDIIFFNYSFKFLLTSLVSVLFIVPVLLFLYDRVLAKEEKDVYHMFLTHHPLSARDQGQNAGRA